MEAALIAHLLAQSTITGLVGNRIKPGRRTQGAPLPAIVVHRIDGQPDYHLTGPSGLVESRVQVDCWSEDYAGAKAAARAVEAAVSGLRFTRGAIRFDAIFVADERDSNFDEAGTALYRTSLDIIVHHASAS